MSWCGSVWFYLLRLLFLYLEICFFLQFRQFLAIISKNTFSNPFSFSSPGAPIKQILVHLIFSPGPLNYPHLKNLFSFFAVLIGWFALFCHPNHFHILLYQRLLHFPPGVLFISAIIFFSFDWLFFIFSNSLLKFSLCPSIILSNLVTILIAKALHYFIWQLFISVLFMFVFDIYFFLLFFKWDKSPCLLIFLFFIYLYKIRW